MIIYANIFIHNTICLRYLRGFFQNIRIPNILDWLDLLQRRIWFWWIKKLLKWFLIDYLCRWGWNWRVISYFQIYVFKVLGMALHFFKVLLNLPYHFIDSLNAHILVCFILLFVIVWIKILELNSWFILYLIYLTYFFNVILIMLHL